MTMNRNGLTSEEVRTKKEQGLVNVNPDAVRVRSVGQILFSNLFTFFNILNLAFFALIVSVGSYKNATFFFVILINSAIGIFQELRTRRLLNKLSLLNTPLAFAVRDGKEEKIHVSEIVLGDLIVLRSGMQIPSDARIVEGEVEVNESLLTGEPDNLLKKAEAEVFSGTFVASGEALAEVIRVGRDNTVETISSEAKRRKRVDSGLRNGVNKLLRFISFIIIPLCVGMFCKQFFLQHDSFRSAVEQMVASGVGMIPEGLYLLTTIALTLGVFRLAKKKTLVQELYCIETLARVDVLCLDKTGTLTEGSMEVREVGFLGDTDQTEVENAIANVFHAQKDLNETGKALAERFGEPKETWEVKKVIPFSSDRKYSGVSFVGHGTYYVGAQAFICPSDESLTALTKEQAEKGFRVVVAAHSKEERDDYALPDDLTPVCSVVLSDKIRKDCRETLEFFKQQGVALKCISGDDPLTVSKIAASVGFENADRFVDASTLNGRDEILSAVQNYTVFGRVKPEQKKTIVECLQQDGHTVAMTGDGVNDVMAMKQANCSVAMASGSDAAKLTADVVLLDSDFSAMPSIFNEGRRVINNISAGASMYLIKTTFSVLLALFTILLGKAYPFVAIQISVIGALSVGAPTFLLQFEPNFSPIPKHFMSTVIRNAFPAGFTVFLLSFLITNVGTVFLPDEAKMLQTVAVFATGWIYFTALRKLYQPLDTYRKIVIYTMEILYLLALIFGQKILDLAPLSANGVLILVVSFVLSPMLIEALGFLYDKALLLAGRIRRNRRGSD